MFYTVEQHKICARHIAFFLSVILIFVGSITIASMNAGPIILGTEMNDNGRVEYLCLGNGCEDFTVMRWNDQ